jgi:hypothetical protein
MVERPGSRTSVTWKSRSKTAADYTTGARKEEPERSPGSSSALCLGAGDAKWGGGIELCLTFRASFRIRKYHGRIPSATTCREAFRANDVLLKHVNRVGRVSDGVTRQGFGRRIRRVTLR